MIDILDFVKSQKKERESAFIIHGRPRSGKSAFARKLAERCGGVYVDVLSRVANDPGLCRKVDLLDEEFLIGLAKESSAAGSLVVLDDWDFLIPVWGGDLSRLLNRVRKLQAPELTVVSVFILRTQPSLETTSLRSSRGQSRVLEWGELAVI